MKTGQAGKELIKQFEGCRLRSYICPAGVLTIGYGHTGKDVVEDMIITEKKADELLCNDLVIFEKQLNSLELPINQNQFDALISFIFNLGFGSLLKSTLLKKIKVNPLDPTISSEFVKWNKAGGVVLSGLMKRRRSEAELYFKVC